MNPPTARTPSAPRRRLQFLAGILVLSTVLSVALAINNAARLGALNWTMVALTPVAAVAVWLVSRSRPLDPRLAGFAVGLLALRLAIALVLQVSQVGLTMSTLVFNIGLPIFFLYYLVTAVREIRREAAAA